ncbi:MAG: hypothetical protein IJS15_02735 [Victivallales bacterium]|nr:hypothetical protein [Victivallales bacterium]
MKKLIFSILALAAVAAMAGVVDPFRQFGKVGLEGAPANTEGYYYADIVRAEQPNAPIIKMHVPEKSTVWLTHIVDTWNSSLEVPDLNTVYDMGSHKYGYIYASAIDDLNAEKSTYQDKINWSTPDTNIVTYTIDNPPEYKNGTDGDLLEVKAKGYLLDSFESAADIYLVMTPLGQTEDLDSYQFADDGAGPHEQTILESRKNSELDKASNVRVNFGIHTEDEREFVAVYEKIETDDRGGASGQPLPGLLLTGLLSLGTVAVGKKMKKRA